MKSKELSTSLEDVQSLIYEVRGKRIIIDSDLAHLYGTTTKRLNEQVKRNKTRFPEDFMFRLSVSELKELVANCDQFNDFKHLGQPPRAFTEYGVIMAANVLNSQKAIEMSLFVVRAFVRMRELAGVHKDLIHKLNALERKYDSQFATVFDAIRALMTPPSPKRKQIGF